VDLPLISDLRFHTCPLEGHQGAVVTIRLPTLGRSAGLSRQPRAHAMVEGRAGRVARGRPAEVERVPRGPPPDFRSPISHLSRFACGRMAAVDLRRSFAPSPSHRRSARMTGAKASSDRRRQNHGRSSFLNKFKIYFRRLQLEISSNIPMPPIDLTAPAVGWRPSTCEEASRPARPIVVPPV
jgi:hypothetical protein